MNRRTFVRQDGLAVLTAPVWSPLGFPLADPRLDRIGITTVCFRSRFAKTRTMAAEPTTAPELTPETAPDFIASELGLHNVGVLGRPFAARWMKETLLAHLLA
jgi:hypothetical protein